MFNIINHFSDGLHLGHSNRNQLGGGGGELEGEGGGARWLSCTEILTCFSQLGLDGIWLLCLFTFTLGLDYGYFVHIYAWFGLWLLSLFIFTLGLDYGYFVHIYAWFGLRSY